MPSKKIIKNIVLIDLRESSNNVANKITKSRGTGLSAILRTTFTDNPLPNTTTKPDKNIPKINAITITNGRNAIHICDMILCLTTSGNDEHRKIYILT